MATMLRAQLELGPQAAAEARVALAPLERQVPRDVLDDLRLLVTELVTNSFHHSEADDGTAKLTVHVDGECVHVEVEDAGKGFTPPPRSSLTPDRESGWGLTIVEQLADHWGVIRDGSTIVWFDLHPKDASRGGPGRPPSAVR